ncbi:DUF2575 family protein [Citrobacter rodentium]|uniref:Membrane protein n=1 Tax=Citrobacter rodentium (strain ICC168) TaxID=637910 RepID=D2TGJ8_CITRI|nr:DUF2575 family protein [Citrobacter rodentium]KIQ51212.1 hypothetical protein TA05_11345 [Citrobacter rodentium]CBG86802.1 putative membrane protein [Citrobacter rodentium ICC168]
MRRSLRSDGAGFYQLAGREYSFSARKIELRCLLTACICLIAMKSILFLFRGINRRLTLTAVQGILWRFSLF